MHFFKTENLSSKDNKKLLIGSVIPRPIALVTTQSHEGILNIAPFSYFNIVSYSPPMISISILRQGGQEKDTVRNILARGEAVVHGVNIHSVEAANRSSIDFDYNQSEVAYSGLTPVKSHLIETPGLKEAPFRFECQIFKRIIIEDDGHTPVADLVLLKVKGVHVSDEVYDSDRHYISADQLQIVSRLAGDDYGTLGQTFSLTRPEKE